MGAFRTVSQTEGAYVRTAFDWQNAVYVVFIMLCILVAKWLYQRHYEFHFAQSYAGASRASSLRFSLGSATSAEAPGSAATAGYGGDEEGEGGQPTNLKPQKWHAAGKGQKTAWTKNLQK